MAMPSIFGKEATQFTSRTLSNGTTYPYKCTKGLFLAIYTGDSGQYVAYSVANGSYTRLGK